MCLAESWIIKDKHIFNAKKKKEGGGTSLVVQWVRLSASNAVGPGLIPGRGTRSPKKSACRNKYPTCRNEYPAQHPQKKKKEKKSPGVVMPGHLSRPVKSETLGLGLGLQSWYLKAPGDSNVQLGCWSCLHFVTEGFLNRRATGIWGRTILPCASLTQALWSVGSIPQSWRQPKMHQHL